MELFFYIDYQGNRSEHRLRPGAKLYIGRAPRCAVHVPDIGASTQHVELTVAEIEGPLLELRAKDLSLNGTGVVVTAGGSPRDSRVRDLCKNKEEVLYEGSALVIPRRRHSSETWLFVPQDVLYTFHFPSQAPVPGLPPHMKVDSSEDLTGFPDCWRPGQGGRWIYKEKLGEGGLAAVYKADDVTGRYGEVAIKVLKYPDRAHWGKQFAFAMHREAQWSMQRLHNEQDQRFRADKACFFAKYLEDHTGFTEGEWKDMSFDAKRRRFEAPNYDWEKEPLSLPPEPYVVIEFIKGDGLNTLMDREKLQKSQKAPDDKRGLSISEKREVLRQAAEALLYLKEFGLLHRDFRGVNMHLEDMLPAPPRLKVLDLGVMIDAEDGQMWNNNQSVQSFQERGQTQEKKRRYDWLPWEVRAAADGQAPAVNFMKPASSFDIFSYGVLALHLLLGRSEAREALEKLRLGEGLPSTKDLGLSPDLVERMFAYEASQRPLPEEVVQSFNDSDPRILSRQTSARTLQASSLAEEQSDDEDDAFGKVYRGRKRPPPSSASPPATSRPSTQVLLRFDPNDASYEEHVASLRKLMGDLTDKNHPGVLPVMPSGSSDCWQFDYMPRQ